MTSQAILVVSRSDQCLQLITIILSVFKPFKLLLFGAVLVGNVQAQSYPSKPVKVVVAFTACGTTDLLARVVLSASHIPYKGAEALRDLLAGRIQFMFATIPSVMPLIAAGKLRAIAVSSLKRSRSMPDVPTVAEKGFPGFEAGAWFAVFAPKGTPPEALALINKQVNEILLIPAIEQQMVAQCADPVGGSAAQLGQVVQREHDKWRLIVRESGATVE